MKAEITGRAAWRLHSGVILLLLTLAFWRLVLPALLDKNFGIVVDADRGGWSSDFAAHLTFAKAFWHGKAGYDVDSHLRITSERCGRPVEHALPFGYSPTMLWVLGPLCLLPDAWAYTAWTLLGVAAVWWMTRPPRSIWLVAAFFTPAAFSCLQLGQTALLTTAGLLYLMVSDLEGSPASGQVARIPCNWGDAVVLWALTAKPPLALVAGSMLLVGRRWRPIAQAGGLCLISTVLLTPKLGINWVGDYVNLLTHYDIESANPAYVWSMVPETMGNLRALLHVTFGLGDSAASRWSGGLWLFALAAILVIGLRRRLPIETCWGLTVLAYLLLCPHVTSTEELQLAVVLTLFTNSCPRVTNAARWAVIGLVLGVLYLAPGLRYQATPFGPLHLRDPLRVALRCAGTILLAVLVCTQWLTARTPGPRRQMPAA